jgi:ATP-binding cassette subfamily B protein
MMSNNVAIALVRRALVLVWKSGPIWTIASAIILFTQAILPLLFLYVLKVVVDLGAAIVASQSNNVGFGDIVMWLAIASGIGLFQALSSAIGRLVADTQVQAVTDYVSDILHAKSIEVDLEYYENADYRNSLHRAQRDAPYRPPGIVNGLLGLFGSTAGLLVMVGLLFTFHWAAVPILCAASLPTIVLRVKYARKIYDWHRERTPAERSATYFSGLLTDPAYAKELRLFDLGHYFRGQFREVRQELRQQRLRITARRSLAEFAGDASAVLGMFLVLVLLGYQTFTGAITIGGLAMYFAAVNRARTQMSELLMSMSRLYEDYLFLAEFFRFVDIKPRLRDSNSPTPMPRPITKGIVFDHVSFRYPNSGDFVLRDASLTVRSGEHIALVGLNGAGKTTLVKLLCRLYDPTTGMISIDDIDLRNFDRRDLRRQIAAVMQDYAKYQLSARQNVWFGDIGLDANDERIRAAAELAGAHEFIDTLEQGYETFLGTMFKDVQRVTRTERRSVAKGGPRTDHPS